MRPLRITGLLFALAGSCAAIGCDRPAGSPSTPAGTAIPAHTGVPAAPASGEGGEATAAEVASAAPVAAAAAQRLLVVHLVPLGNVSPSTMEQTAKGLKEHAPVSPVIEPARTPPARARSPRKGAWQATVLLDWLDTLPMSSGGKVMGVTEAEVVTRKGSVPIWGILGMGSVDGRCSVISTWRMRRVWENGGAPEALVRERLWKIAIHELGHTLGLEHCPRLGCIMEDGHGTVKTVDRDIELCADCERRFSESLQRNAR